MRVEISEKISGYGSCFAAADKTRKNTAGERGFIEDIKRGFEEEPESVVGQYKQRHPEDAANVDSQVRAGRKLLAECGLGDVDRKPSAVSNGEKKESWWDKRHKRMKEQMAEDVRKARLRRAAHQAQERQKYWMESFEGRQRMEDFFNMRAYEEGKRRTQGLSAQLFMTAVVAYDKNILDTSRKTNKTNT